MQSHSPADPREALRRHFGFPDFRLGQEEALGHVLARRDVLVVMPTGSGKSLIYQLAALLLPGTALVISPLIALMKDQIDGLNRRGIAAMFINSSLDGAEQARRLRALAGGEYKIVLVAPERLRSRAFREAIGRVPLSLLAVDEAHCLSQWGHDFRPDYLHIAEARTEFKAPVTLALTATATPRVQDEIIRLLGLAGAERIITGFNRSNLTFEVFSAPDVKAKLNLVRDFLGAAEGAGIIYTGTRRDAEEVAEFVRDVAGIETRHYHAALEPEARAETQDAFMAGDLPIVVATNAFGMGIDRPDVRFVLHYNMPGTLEAYYQEAGRAGRDGLPARAVLLYSPKDTALQEYFVENDSPGADDLRAVHSFLSRAQETRMDDVERATGLPQTKARVALEQLEIAGAMRRLPDEAYGVLRVEALPLEEPKLHTVAAQVAERREHKYRQLDIIVDYAETNACRRRTILDHFGDSGSAEAPLCCDNCLARAESVEAELRTAQTQSERAALIVLDTIGHLKWEIGKGKLAQILKGSSAQDMARYARARNFGKFAALRLAEIESLIDQLIDAAYLKQVGSERPTLKLTPRGEAALKARSAIRVDLRTVQPGTARRLRAEREAGGTVALTGQMLGQGRSPEQIAAERGLTVGTIYSHLAQLIANGQVSVDAVVPADVQRQVRVAINKVGSAGYLAPIKAILPEDIEYSVIRCVVEAWKREQSVSPETAPVRETEPLSRSTMPPAALIDLPFEPLRHWRHTQATALGQPDYYLFGDGALRELAHRRPRTKAELRSISGLSAEVIEKYGDDIIIVIHDWSSTRVIKAIFECVRLLPNALPRSGVAKLLVGSGSKRVDEFRSHPLYNRLSGLSRTDVMTQVDALIEIGLLTQDAKGHLVLSNVQSPRPQPATQPPNQLPPQSFGDPVDKFLARPHPRPLKGPWRAGWALDFHSRFDGDQQVRSVIGELAFRFKYGGEQHLARDLAARWVELLAAHPEMPKPDAVIPIPPSIRRDFDPVTLLAQALAAQLSIPALTGVLVKTRATRLQKDMTALAQKQANVVGAFVLKGDVRGKRLILVDDLYDSGATLAEATRVLTRGGATSLIVLTLTKTIHADA